MTTPGIVPLGDGTVAVFSPFAAKDEIKAIPGARWNPDLKCWIVPAFMQSEARAILARYAARDKTQSRPPVDRSGTSWGEAMFAALPVRLHEPAYKALAKVVHPDIGGDTRAAQVLNDAWATRRAA